MSQAPGPGSAEGLAEHCAGCDDELGEVEQVFTVGPEVTLCFACAVARGGRWDDARRRWSTHPDYTDLGEGFD